MAQIEKTRKEFIDDLIEAIEYELGGGSVDLTDGHVEKILEILRPFFEEMDWFVSSAEEGFEEEIRAIIFAGGLPGIFEENIGSFFFENNRDEAAYLIQNEEMGPIEAGLILMARGIDGNVCHAIASKIEEFVGSDYYVNADPYEELEFND